MTTTSREYAEALFELAAQENLLRETSEGLETVVSALLQTPEYQALLASPAIGKAERLAALDQAFRGKVPEILLAILRKLLDKVLHVGILGSHRTIFSLGGSALNDVELHVGVVGAKTLDDVVLSSAII